MTIIYDELVDFSSNNTEIERDARELISEMVGEPYDAVDDFIKSVVIESLTKYGVIREAFSPCLKSWKWERLPLLTQAILLMSYAHYYFVDKTDKSVIIDIAVTLAKKYIDVKQAQFINAILDGVLKK